MKPTSIIFLILAAILIVSGIILCVIGGVMADSQGIELLSDSVDSDGNAITQHSLEDYTITDIDINIKDADVNIYGQSTKSYIEFKNINHATYDFRIYNKKLTLESINPFNIVSIIKFRENNGGFDGLRHYLHINKFSDDISEVNIYLKPGDSIDNINITSKDGNINIKNMICDTAYTLKTDEGHVVFENTRTDSTVTTDIKKGNFTFDRSSAYSVTFDIKNGNGKFMCNKQFNFYCSCESGTIYTDDENRGSEDSFVFPIITQIEGTDSPEDANGSDGTDGSEGTETTPAGLTQVYGKIKSGDLAITRVE